MLILASENSRFSLDIVGYQFPGAELDGWDSEWLVVAGTVECPRGAWTFRDPCLTTFELRDLAEWLSSRNESGSERRIDFTEPNLAFTHKIVADRDVLELSLSLESAPPWLKGDERLSDGYTLQIPFSSLDFTDAIQSIRALCQLFPERTNRGGG